jgi:hypothetical protein
MLKVVNWYCLLLSRYGLEGIFCLAWIGDQKLVAAAGCFAAWVCAFVYKCLRCGGGLTVDRMAWGFAWAWLSRSVLRKCAFVYPLWRLAVADGRLLTFLLRQET